MEFLKGKMHKTDDGSFQAEHFNFLRLKQSQLRKLSTFEYFNGDEAEEADDAVSAVKSKLLVSISIALNFLSNISASISSSYDILIFSFCVRLSVSNLIEMKVVTIKNNEIELHFWNNFSTFFLFTLSIWWVSAVTFLATLATLQRQVPCQSERKKNVKS